MIFWLIAGGITALAAATLALSVFRARGGGVEYGNDIPIYRDQLEEIGRDQARGVLSQDDSARLKLEISRRLLEADRKAAGSLTLNKGSSGPIVAVVVLVLFGGTIWLYNKIGAPGYPDMPISTRLSDAEEIRLNRPSQEAIEAAIPAPDPQTSNPALSELMVKLRTALQTRPDDLQGHILLAQNEAQLGNFAAAQRAQARVLALKGDQVTAADYADYVDLLALAADGYVSPIAEDAANRALAIDPRNGTARYYLGLMQAQNGRPDLAFVAWRDLLEQSRPEAPWIPPIRRQIGFAAKDAGIEYTLPELDFRAPNLGGPILPGPDAGDVAAAQDMSEDERNQMIAGMVSQLMDRLASQGGPPEEWARLIGALAVLGDVERASAILQEAQTIFADSAQAMALLRETAARAGLGQ